MDRSSKSIEAEKADITHVETAEERLAAKLEEYQQADVAPKEQW